MGKIFTFSNFLSVLRVLLVAPFVYFFQRGETTVAFVIALVAIASDWFDGQVARWTNSVSDTGKVLDPLADKLTAGLVALYFLWRGELPLWFVISVVVRDVIIFAGGIYANRKRQVITTSLLAGKWATGFLALMFVALMWPNPPFDAMLLKEIFMWAAVVLLVISLVQYTSRFFRLMNGETVTP
ncbi:MAG: CDP-alcohol phosphatidyltransferase family protein [Rhizobacter sp.]|nr:CDP-alcohol phosphatidyltransferase family protein [Chlorobiales bacterium]